MSSIGRAFTTRRAKQGFQSSESAPQRSNTTKGFGSIRNKISGPVELVHTTNMLSYNAPDIYPKEPKSATSISSSGKSDDDMSDSARTSSSSPPTSPDIPTAPKRDMSPEPNHLSSYFAAPGHEVASGPKPEIPQRAPSHTSKGSKSYSNLGRQRSMSQLSEQSSRTVSTKASFTFSRSSSTSTNTSASSHLSSHSHHVPKLSNPPVPAAPPRVPSVPLRSAQSQPQLQQHRKDYSQTHPFGKELAQVSEIAEEFGVKDRLNVIDAEEKELQEMGLCKFRAEDYLDEIQGLYDSIFGLVPRPLKAPAPELWI
ncbi:hypothetical protein GQ53DRAFT_408625 [Thozetella sp. PMI_491]|nr:hypothetical protein GQ53DRAFT_408625 [Thozetella sp. PMI_491]